MVVGEIAHERDIVVIGGGPGGYTAAIRAAQLGRSVTLIEKEKLGGVCLNKGCIPSKLLAQSASKWKDFQKSSDFGFEISGLSINHQLRQRHKEKVIRGLIDGISSLCKSQKIEVLHGNAFFLSENKVGVEQKDAYEVYQFKKAIIATGGKPVNDLGIEYDNKKILDSWSVSSLAEIPEHLVVYGSDTVSLEAATSYRVFGASVTLVLDAKNDFDFDSSINRELVRLLKKDRIKILKGFKLAGVCNEQDKLKIKLTGNDEEQFLLCSHLFIAGRNQAGTKELGIDRLGMTLTKEGFIEIDRQCRTSLTNIFAVGDVTKGPPLAVKAIKQGKVAAESATGKKSEVDLRFLPVVIHSNPPIASVGLTEDAARMDRGNIITSQFSLAANGFASMIEKRDGLVKIIADGETELILGIHMIGERAIELITTGTFALEMCARTEDLMFPLYPHPSLMESLLEAVEQLSGQSIHTTPSKIRDAIKSL